MTNVGHIHTINAEIWSISRFKCHKDCVNKAIPTCGLPEELVDAVMMMKSVFEGESRTVEGDWGGGGGVVGVWRKTV